MLNPTQTKRFGGNVLKIKSTYGLPPLIIVREVRVLSVLTVLAANTTQPTVCLPCTPNLLLNGILQKTVV